MDSEAVMVDVAVIGGGASGMIAAGRAAELGTRVVLLEKGNRLGRKLLISGKGRCNLTNIAELNDFLKHFGRTRDFLRNVFHRFFNEELMEFFQIRGLNLKLERGGRVFPEENKASALVKVLIDYLLNYKVKVLFDAKAEEILIEHRRVKGVKLRSKEVLKAKKIVLSTGGKSYPLTGSSGDGYILARKLGHTIIKLRPALVPLLTKETFVSRLQGLTLRNVKMTVFAGKRKVISEFGEVLFTHFGLSGPVILSLSADAVMLLEKEKELRATLDLKPALEKGHLLKRFIRDTRTFGRKSLKNYLKEILPQKMIPVFIERWEVSPDKKLNQLTKDERNRLINLLKNFTLTVAGARPLSEAMVTCGGVCVKEINPQTMESKLIEGLYLAGELIDIEAKTGGYNLQAAFSTGYIAGESAAKSLIERGY